MTATIGEHVNVFQPNPNGEHILNTEALATLISWAEGDEILAARFGTWDQGQWAKAVLANSAAADGAATYQIDTDTVFEETRNGACQTAYCMAGQTVVQAGYRLIYTRYGSEGEGRSGYNTSDCIKQEFIGYDQNKRPRFRDTGQVVSISFAAQQILGLDHDEQAVLFDGDNDLDTLKALINIFCTRRGLPQMYGEIDEPDRAYHLCDQYGIDMDNKVY